MGQHPKLNRDIILREPQNYTSDSVPCNSSLLEVVNVRLVRIFPLASDSEIHMSGQEGDPSTIQHPLHFMSAYMELSALRGQRPLRPYVPNSQRISDRGDFRSRGPHTLCPLRGTIPDKYIFKSQPWQIEQGFLLEYGTCKTLSASLPVVHLSGWLVGQGAWNPPVVSGSSSCPSILNTCDLPAHSTVLSGN